MPTQAITKTVSVMFRTPFNTCPLLIKQLRADLPKVKDKAKRSEAKKLTDECEKLHKEGKHAESVAKCEEAATVAGIKLDMKK